ncbi:MAG TPA: MGMT family protein [Candidatus Thermoplasmatota archaeon]|nr:MGMT family protein [Candidatus Thermoplasmatota archaeon]
MRPTAFAGRVHAAVRAVPPGRVATYGDVALAVGRPGAARAVGRVMAATRDPAVPCHRVVRADGQVALGGRCRMAERLRREGVPVRDGRVVGLQGVRWRLAGAHGPPATQD